MPSRSGSVKARILYIDVARFYAMAMVFCGHFIERVMLLMLFSVEMIHLGVFRFLKGDTGAARSDRRILIAIPIFYIIGYYLNLYGDFLNLARHRM